MADGFPLVWLIDFMLVILVVEIGFLTWRWRRNNSTQQLSKSAGPSPARFLPTLMSGVFLVIALRAVLSDAHMLLILACLNGSLIAHVIDLWRMHRK